MTEVMQHPVNFRKRRIMEALREEEEEAARNEPVLKAGTQDDTISVVYEKVIEEVVYDDILLYDGALEEIINSPRIRSYDILPKDEFETVSDDEATISVDLDAESLYTRNTATRQSDRKRLIDEHKGSYNAIFMKLSILEDWEECKRNFLEFMVKEVAELQDLQDRYDNILEVLEEQNLQIDEDELAEFKKEYMAENPIHEPLDELLEVQPQTPKKPKKQNKRTKISATSTPISSKRHQKSEVMEMFEANEDGLVVIGPNGTTIAKKALTAINWKLSGAALTRKILMEVFDRETLAFHTLTGKPSPAFMDCDKPMKNQLDPLKVADIIHLVMEHTKLSAKEVRNAITTKCADENKMYRQREKKRQNAAQKLQDKEQQNK